MSGWIKSHRKMLDNPIVCKDSDHLAVWMYILLHATHKEYQVVFAGEKILLHPGQLITGRKSISDKFNISESKVQRILKSFENEQQIEQQSSNKNRLVTVLSWVDYQDSEQQNEIPVNNKRTTTEQQVNTNKNVKNDNKKYIIIPPKIEDVKAYCEERKNSVDPEKWFDSYASKGWMVGKTKMKDWKAAVRTWEKNSFDTSAKNVVQFNSKLKKQNDLTNWDTPTTPEEIEHFEKTGRYDKYEGMSQEDRELLLF